MSRVDASPRRAVAVVSGVFAGWTLESALEVVARSGAEAVELTIGPGGHVEPGELDRARQAVSASGLRLCGVAATLAWPLGHPGLRSLVAEASRGGAAFVRVFPPPYDDVARPLVQIAAAAAALRSLATVAEATRVLIEPTTMTVAPSPELALRIIEQSEADSAGVVYDPANLTVEGGLHPAYAVALLGERIGHVHVKNRGVERVDGRWTSRYAELGDGLVAWPEVIGALDHAGYDGAYSIDHLSGPKEAATLERDLAALVRVLAGRLETAADGRR